MMQLKSATSDTYHFLIARVTDLLMELRVAMFYGDIGYLHQCKEAVADILVHLLR